MYGERNALGALIIAAGLAAPMGHGALYGEAPSHDGWNAVTEQLEPGGTVYMYLDTEVILEELVTSFSQYLGIFLMHQPVNPVAGMDLDDLLNEILGRIGILDVKAAGVSTVKLDGHEGNRVRTVLYMEEKRGFFSTIDLDDQQRVDLTTIPESAVVFSSGWTRFDNIMPMIRDLVAMVEELSGFPVDIDGQLHQIGIDPDQILNSLTGESSYWIAFGDSVSVPLDEIMPGLPPVVIPEVYGAVTMGTTDDTLFQRIKESFDGHQSVDSSASSDTRITFNAVEESPFSTQFIIDQQADRLVIVSSPNSFTLIEEAIAGQNISADPLFARLSSGKPDGADSITYVNPRLYNEFLSLMAHPMLGAVADDPEMLALIDFWKSLLEIDNGTFTARKVSDKGVQWFQQGEVTSMSGVQVMLLPVTAVPQNYPNDSGLIRD